MKSITHYFRRANVGGNEASAGVLTVDSDNEGAEIQTEEQEDGGEDEDVTLSLAGEASASGMDATAADNVKRKKALLGLIILFTVFYLYSLCTLVLENIPQLHIS